MSWTPEDARWELLPDDALGFFGLAPGFDRQELRRRYGRLIKRHRPDDDPVAFQRVRAAYEALQERAAAVTPATPLGAVAPEVEARLREALAAEGPSAALEALLTGAAAHPGEPRILALLEAVLAELPVDEADDALRRLAGVLPAVELLRRTRVLWRRWLLAGDPGRFEAAWADLVEASPAPGERSVLALSLLRSAALRLSDAWVERVRASLNDAAVDDEGALDHDLDLLAPLRAYRAARDTFLAGARPLAVRVDRIVHAVADDEPDAARELLTLLGEVRDAPRLAVDAVGDDPAAGIAVLTLHRLVDELGRQGRLGLAAPAAPEGKGRGLEWLPRRVDRIRDGVAMALLALAAGALAGLIVPTRLMQGRGEYLVLAMVAGAVWWATRRALERLARREHDLEPVAALVAWGGLQLGRLGGSDGPHARLARHPGLRLIELARRWAHA